MGNLDFEKDFLTDEEIEEMFDNIMSVINEQNEGVSTTLVTKPDRVQDVLYTYKVLKYLTKGTNAKVTYELHKPYVSMGNVSVCGNNLAFTKTKWFIVAVKLASNFNVYPKTNGTVQMDFTFHGLTTTLE